MVKAAYCGRSSSGLRHEQRVYVIIAYMRYPGLAGGGDAAATLRTARRAAEISQAQLAARAGTTQSAISRLESGASSPSVASLTRLLSLMGQRLELTSVPMDGGVDRSMISANLAIAPEERVRRGLVFSDLVRRNRGAVGG